MESTKNAATGQANAGNGEILPESKEKSEAFLE